jgi:hypothetical protein
MELDLLCSYRHVPRISVQAVPDKTTHDDNDTIFLNISVASQQFKAGGI